MNRENKPRAELVLSMEKLSLVLVRLSKKLKVFTLETCCLVPYPYPVSRVILYM